MGNRIGLWLLPAVIVFAGVAFAQTNLSRLVGTVRDASGAAVAGATVVVTNDGTGWTREFHSQPTGDYEVPNLLAGTYSIAVQATGFKQFVRRNIVLDAGRTVRTDVDLVVGDVTEQVRVVAEAAAVVETDTPSIKNTISYNLQVKAANSTGNRPWEMLTTVPA
ncbi:MAG: carboxypeptidase-like regulatory domain-containing protein, partial [Gammaproteobacteria bacterium]